MQGFTRRFVSAKASSVDACSGFFGAGVYARAAYGATVWIPRFMLISPAWPKLVTALATAVTLMALHFWSWISADRTQRVKTTDSPLESARLRLLRSLGEIDPFHQRFVPWLIPQREQVRLRQAREDIRFMAVIGLFQ